MDDKRTLIAFLLVGLIFLLMPYYYDLMGIEQPAPEPVAVQEARRDSLAASGDSLAARQGTESAVPAVPAETRLDPAATAAPAAVPDAELAEPSAARIVEVTTPLQRLQFTTAGGNLVSVQLAQYQRALGGPVELLPAGAEGLSLTVESETGRGDRMDLSRVHFEPSAEQVAIDAGGVGRLDFVGRLRDGRVVEKRITVHGDRYGIDVSVRLQGFDEGTLVFAHWRGGVALAEREANLDVPQMKSMAYINESLVEVQVDEDDEAAVEEDRGDLRWAGVRNKYFLAAFAPLEESRQRVELSGRPISREPFRDYGMSVGTLWADVEGGHWDLLVYLGPLDLEQVAPYERDFSRAMNLGFPVVRDIAKVLLQLFVVAYQWIPNYGWVIVVFGIVVKILVYPLTHKSYESASKMQELQPKIQALREKYKNNNQKLSQETMKLYREEGVNPVGGCLPMLFQMPIFIALYQVFSSAIQLRQTPWILWVEDLSLPDAIPLGDFDLHVLPLLMATAMFFQSKMTMRDPKQAALVYIMPVVMVFIMWSFSSGLVLYWTVFNVLQIGQQVLTNHLKAKKEAAQATPRG